MKIHRHNLQRYNDIIRDTSEDVDLLARDAFDIAIYIFGNLQGQKLEKDELIGNHKLLAIHHPAIHALLRLAQNARASHDQLVAYWHTTPEYALNPKDNFESDQIRLKNDLHLLNEDQESSHSIAPKTSNNPNVQVASSLMAKPIIAYQNINSKELNRHSKKLVDRKVDLQIRASLLACESDYRDQFIGAQEENTGWQITPSLTAEAKDLRVQLLLSLAQEIDRVIVLF